MLRLSPLQEASICDSVARLNIWSGAVRSGKTVASLLRWLEYVHAAPRGGALVVSGRTMDTVARNVFGPLSDPALTGPAAAHVHYTRGAPTGSILGRQVEVITASDARAEARLRGLTAAGGYVDELTLIPEAFFTQLLARLSVPSAKLFATTNPDGPSHWVRRKFLLRAGELDLRHWHFRIEDNHSLDPAYISALKTEYTGLWYRRFILGEWVAAEGAIYDMWDEARHVTAQLPPIERWISVGVDHGTRNPFHAVLLGLGIDRRLHVTTEWRWDSSIRRRQLSDVEYSRHLRDWLEAAPIPTTDLRGVEPERIVVDPSATGFRVQLHHDGASTALADNAVLPGIRTVSSLLALGLLDIHESCRELIAEIPGYSWDDKAAEHGQDQPIKAADHGVDALRYAIHSTRAMWRPYLAHLLHDQTD